MSNIYQGINEQVITDLIDGAVGVIPTDTLYGIVAVANNQDAVAKLYKIKNRDKKPGTIIAANIDQLVELGIKRRYLKAVEHFWPGAVSVVIPIGHNLEYLHRGAQSLAVRVPDNAPLRELLEKTGPLLTSSANLPGKTPATDIEEAQKYFGDGVDFYLVGGKLEGKPSTIIRVVDDAIEVLREGAVILDEGTGRITK